MKNHIHPPADNYFAAALFMLCAGVAFGWLSYDLASRLEFRAGAAIGNVGDFLVVAYTAGMAVMCLVLCIYEMQPARRRIRKR